MNANTMPSLALPIRMPRFQPALLPKFDSESAEYRMSFLSMNKPLGLPNWVQLAMWLAVLVEDLHAVVLAVADEEAPLRIHRERVRVEKLSGSRARLAPRLDERAVFRELDDAVVPFDTVAVDDEDVAVRGDEDVGRSVELARPVAGNASLSEPHELFPLGAELDDLVAAAFAAARVRHPNVIVRVDENAVRPLEQARAKALQELP